MIRPKENMSDAEAVVWRMRHHGWGSFLRKLKKRALFIADDDVLTTYSEMYGDFVCKTANPDNAMDHIKGSGNIVVFTRKGERALVKKIKAAVPENVGVFSATYELAAMSTRRPITLDRLKSPGKYKAKKAPLVILTTPGSDAHYMIRLMDAAGLGKPLEHLTPFIAEWASQSASFDTKAYLKSVMNYEAEHGRFFTIMYSDVLQSMRDSGSMDMEWFQEWLSKSNADVIYIPRRDKMMQAGLLSILQRTAFRSVWDITEREREIMSFKPAEFAETYRLTQQLVTQEVWLEELLKDHESTKFVSLEDMLASPREVLTQLGHFIGNKTKPKAKLVDYKEAYDIVPDLFDRSTAYRRELIDRLGLHANDAGSLVGLTESLIGNKTKGR